jgi:hypothetical protein
VSNTLIFIRGGICIIDLVLSGGSVRMLPVVKETGREGATALRLLSETIGCLSLGFKVGGMTADGAVKLRLKCGWEEWDREGKQRDGDGQ